MTKRHSGHVLSTALDTLVKNPLNQADDNALVRAAKDFWYSNSNLMNEVRSFLDASRSDVEVRRAGYLLERFTRFSCASNDRVSEALNALKMVAPSYRKETAPAVPAKGRSDRLALSWGLNEGLGLKAQSLMPYQTRHYEAEQRELMS